MLLAIGPKVDQVTPILNDDEIVEAMEVYQLYNKNTKIVARQRNIKGFCLEKVQYQQDSTQGPR